MLEFLIQVIGEILVQVFFEVLAELGLHSIAAPFRKRPNPWLAAVGYSLLGAMAGGLSIWLFPDNFVVDKHLRLVNLVLTPLVAGFSMSAIGAWRTQRGQAVMRIDKFSYGFLFAFSVALIRFVFGR